MSNMDDFNRCTALVLAKLYDEFPKPIKTLRVADLEPDIDQESLDNFSATLSFLVEEGFIHCDNVGRNSLYLSEARLTSKGLMTLKAMPEAIADESETMADKLKTVIKDGGKQATNAAISQAIGLFLKLYGL